MLDSSPCFLGELLLELLNIHLEGFHLFLHLLMPLVHLLVCCLRLLQFLDNLCFHVLTFLIALINKFIHLVLHLQVPLRDVERHTS